MSTLFLFLVLSALPEAGADDGLLERDHAWLKTDTGCLEIRLSRDEEQVVGELAVCPESGASCTRYLKLGEVWTWGQLYCSRPDLSGWGHVGALGYPPPTGERHEDANKVVYVLDDQPVLGLYRTKKRCRRAPATTLAVPSTGCTPPVREPSTPPVAPRPDDMTSVVDLDQVLRGESASALVGRHGFPDESRRVTIDASVDEFRIELLNEPDRPAVWEVLEQTWHYDEYSVTVWSTSEGMNREILQAVAYLDVVEF